MSSVAKSAKSGKFTTRDVKTLADSNDDDVELEYTKIKHATNKAALFIVDGEDLWLPFTQIVEVEGEADEDGGSVTITGWIASQKGLA